MADLVISLVINDDSLTEGPETFTVELDTPASSTGSDIGLGNASVDDLDRRQRAVGLDGWRYDFT